MAQRAGRWGHQDPQVTPDTGAAPAGGGRTQGAQAKQAADRLAAGALWQETNLVFCTTIGTELDAANVRRGFLGAGAAGLR